MRRTPLKRKTMRRQRARIGPRSKTKKYARRERGWDFMAFVLTQPCYLRGSDGWRCDGRVQADHAGARGLGVKAADDTCIALCRARHQHRTDYTGPFKNWKGCQMREWCDAAIHYYQQFYAKLRELKQTPWRTT